MSKALSKNPEERFARCRQFAEALTDAVTGSKFTERETEAVRPSDRRSRHPSRQWSGRRNPHRPRRQGAVGSVSAPLIALIVGSVILATVVAVAIYATFEHPSSRTPQTPTAQPGPNTSQPVPTSASSSATPSPSATAEPTDYSGLLIQASDIDAPIPFTGSPPTANPNGRPGVATTFSTDDGSRVIKDTILVLADPAAAADALKAAKSGQPNTVKNPTSRPSSVGTGGTTLLGNFPDGSKGVTLLLFTEGKAFVTLEFDGPPNMLAPPDFVTDLGRPTPGGSEGTRRRT